MLYLLLLDADFTAGGQAIAMSSVLMVANLVLVSTIFLETKVHDEAHRHEAHRRSRRIRATMAAMKKRSSQMAKSSNNISFANIWGRNSTTSSGGGYGDESVGSGGIELSKGMSHMSRADTADRVSVSANPMHKNPMHKNPMQHPAMRLSAQAADAAGEDDDAAVVVDIDHLGVGEHAPRNLGVRFEGT